MDYYQILGVQPSDSPEVIKTAYRKLALKHHPDKNQGDLSTEQAFKEVVEAYKTLSDPMLRGMYDLGRKKTEPAPKAKPTVPKERRVYHNLGNRIHHFDPPDLVDLWAQQRIYDLEDAAEEEKLKSQKKALSAGGSNPWKRRILNPAPWE
jgi:DnaJ-class molecular chaperone